MQDRTGATMTGVGVVRQMMVLLAAVLAMTVAGCAGAGQTPSGGSSQPPAGGQTSGMLAPPGLYAQADGTVQALGTLTYLDSEGGFWAVVDTAVAEEADTAKVIAVVTPDSDIAGSMESNRGKYVSIIGNRDDDRTYRAGPHIEGRTIEVVSDTVVE